MNGVPYAIHIIVSGSVQGIGYRKWVKRHAQELGVVGWITNRDDGTVEAVLQGEMQQVEVLMRAVRNGPFLANVTAVDLLEISFDPNIVDFIVIQ